MKNRKIAGELKTTGQQGDVTMRVVEIDLIPELAKSPDKIVRHGEATGHCHEVEGDIDLYFYGDKVLGVVGDGGATLLHEEHEAWTLPTGKTVEFGPTYEWDYDTSEKKMVMD